MANRLTDNAIKSTADFIVRKQKPHLYQLALIFLVAFFTIFFTGQNTGSDIGYYVFLLTLLIVIGSLAWFTIYFSIQTRDTVVITEFQNALFASAAGLSSRFCFIIKRDGTIVYFDPGFQKVFPFFSKLDIRTIDGLLEESGVEPTISNQIYRTLENNLNDKLVIPFKGPRGEPMPMMVTVDALPRPRGFWVVRGRDYVESRSADGTEIGAVNPDIMPILMMQMLSTLPIGMYATSPEGKIYFINSVMEQWLGYGENEIVSRGLSVQDIIYQLSDGRPGDIEVSDFEGEVTFQKKTGALLKTNVTQSVARSASGLITGATAIVDDGSGLKKKSNAALSSAHNEPLLRTFIENSPIAMARINSIGAVIEYNQSFSKLAGEKSLVGSVSFIELLDAPHVKEVSSRLEALLKHPEKMDAHPIDIRFKREEPTTASLFLTRLDHEDGTPEIIVHLIDTTEQKNLEVRFAHSQKMQAVGQLAGGVAHDFNNLLTAMIGFCDLLLMRHPAGDASFADIMQIKQNANRAANLVRQLLAFSRRQTLQPKILDITDVLAELSNLVRRLIGENIELKMTHGRDVGAIRADQGQIEQVLINLAVNARDAMPNGGSLTILTSHVNISGRSPAITRDMIPPSEEDKIVTGDYVLVEIIDTGTGIPKDLVQKIFEPFFSTKEVGSGTGLGLATVYGIIKQTGGYIYVSSKEGVGTKFSLFFKRFAAGEAQPTIEAESSAPSGNDDLTGKSTILLVEDETPVRIFAGRALRNKGYTVLEADCGETALEVMEREGESVEVIVTDVIMPGMNGPTMIETITERYPNRNFKVIFMSGYAEDAFVKTYGEGREFNFLPKPFTLKQLASKVKEIAG